MLLGPALGGVRHPDVDLWMASKGAPGAAALLDFAGQKYGFRNAAGVPRWGSIAADTAFSRASAAGRWPANGPYEMVSSGVLRYDHDPITRAPLGARIEGGASPISTDTTNFATTGSSWAFGGTVALLAANATSMFSGQIATKHTVGTIGSSQSRFQGKTVTANTNYRFEVILERTDPSVTSSAFGLTYGTWLGLVSYNWTTNVLASISGAPSGFIVESLGIGPNGGPLVRLSAVANSGSATSASFYIYPFGILATPTSGQSIILHYACVTPGTTYGSPLIVGSSVVTLAAERLYTSPPSDPAVDGVTIAIRTRTPRATTYARVLYTITQTNLANRYVVYFDGAWKFGHIRNYAVSLLLSAPATPGADVRMSFSSTPAGDLKWCINGGEIIAGASGAPIQGVMTHHYVGCYPIGSEYYSTIERVARWRGTPFTDAELRGLLA